MCNDSAALSSQNNELLPCQLAKKTAAPTALSWDLLGFPMIHQLKNYSWRQGKGVGLQDSTLSWAMPMPYQPSNILITALAFHHGFLSSSLCMCPIVTISPHREKTISYSSLWPTQFLYCDQRRQNFQITQRTPSVLQVLTAFSCRQVSSICFETQEREKNVYKTAIIQSM